MSGVQEKDPWMKLVFVLCDLIIKRLSILVNEHELPVILIRRECSHRTEGEQGET